MAQQGTARLQGPAGLGGALTFIWRDIALRRERESERIDKMFAELASMDDLYNQVKTIRRTLRSLGFARGVAGTRDERVLLTQEQATGFRERCAS